MKSFKEMLGETLEKPKSPDEQHFIDKHIIDKREHPHADEGQFASKAKKAKRKADHEDSKAVYEEDDYSDDDDDSERKIECEDCGAKYSKGEEHECEDMEESSCGSKKKSYRESIVKAVKSKMAIKEQTEELSEAVIDDLKKIVDTKSASQVKFKDGSTLRIDLTTASAMLQVHDKLSSTNAKRFADDINKSEDRFMKMMEFAFSTGKR